MSTGLFLNLKTEKQLQKVSHQTHPAWTCRNHSQATTFTSGLTSKLNIRGTIWIVTEAMAEKDTFCNQVWAYSGYRDIEGQLTLQLGCKCMATGNKSKINKFSTVTFISLKKKLTRTFSVGLFLNFFYYEINYKAFWLQEVTCEMVSKKLQRQLQTQRNHRILPEFWLEEIFGVHTVQLPANSKSI